MKLDSITLASVVLEIKTSLIPAKIVELFQISKYELLFVLKSNYSSKNLFISIRPERMAFFLTDSPAPPENFQSLFFNNLTNLVRRGTLTDIQHYNFDRIIILTIQPYNKFGNPKNFQLIIEFMGKHSNVILIDEGNIIKSPLKQVGSEVNRFREIKAGNPYIFPPEQNKKNLLETNFQYLLDMFTKSKIINENEYLWKFFQMNFKGIGSKTAKEITFFLGFSLEQKLINLTKQQLSNTRDFYNNLIENIKTNNLSPEVLIDKNTGDIIDYSLLLSQKSHDTILIPFGNTSTCLEYVYNKLKEKEKKKDFQNIIKKVLRKNIDKLSEKIALLKKREEDIKNCEELRKKGELIKANLWNIKPGTKEITMVDYTNISERQITIKLNQELTPLQNAKLFFKKYKKLKQNNDRVKNQLKENKKAISRLFHLEEKLSEDSDSLEGLSFIYDQLIKLGYIKKDKNNLKRKKTGNDPSISRFLSHDGWTILAGKNSKQNEYILRHLSSGNDFWLHALNRSGGHIIIKNHKNLEKPPYPTLLFAANLAAYYSKAKDKENALIIFTQRKFVRKPKNSKMGKVIYSGEKTLPITVNHEETKKEINKMLTN